MMQVSMKFITAMVEYTCRVQLDESSCFCVSFNVQGITRPWLHWEYVILFFASFFNVQGVAVTDQGITLINQTRPWMHRKYVIVVFASLFIDQGITRSFLGTRPEL